MLGYRSGYRWCTQQVIYCNSIDLWRVVLNGQLSFFVGIADCVRDCLQPFCDFQIHFIHKLPYSIFEGLKRDYITIQSTSFATK